MIKKTDNNAKRNRAGVQLVIFCQGEILKKRNKRAIQGSGPPINYNLNFQGK